MGREVLDVDVSQTKELVGQLRSEADHAIRQWTTWLGIGSGGGAIAILSFAAALPDPDRALFLLAPSLAAFLLGIVSAGPAVLLLGVELLAASAHFAAAHNRDSIQAAVSKMPFAIASPQAMADRMNASRDKLVAQGDEEHDVAEKAWIEKGRWRFARRVLTTVSAVSFVVGAGYPLVLIAQQVPFKIVELKR
jgi:hypothetical protein